MTDELKLRILDVKSLTHFIVREEETKEAQRYARLEQLLQKTYDICDDYQFGDLLEIGSDVVVFSNPYSDRLPKFWLRAVVKNIFMNCGGFLYCLYLVDYGLEKCVDKLSIRLLRPHLGQTFVGFQAFHFHLTDIESERGIKLREVVKFVKELFANNNNCALAQIENRDSSGSAFGSILLDDDLDLAALLVDKLLAIDISGGKLRKNRIKVIENNVMNTSSDSNNSSIRKPHSSPFIRSANNSYVLSPEHIESIRKCSPKESNNEALNSSTNESQNTVNNDEMSKNSFLEITNINSTTNLNGINGFRRKKLRDLLKQIKSKQPEEQTFDESLSEVTANQSNNEKDNYNMEAEEVAEVEVEEEIEWPVYKSVGYVKLKPAGCQPQSELIERIFTLNRK